MCWEIVVMLGKSVNIFTKHYLTEDYRNFPWGKTDFGYLGHDPIYYNKTWSLAHGLTLKFVQNNLSF